MRSLTGYRLFFRAPVHLGRVGLGREHVSEACPADTLFSALVEVVAETGGGKEVEAFLEPFLQGEPPWLISSAFPFAGEVAFFPRPQLRLSLEEGEVVAGKRLKGLRYVSWGVLRDLAAGRPVSLEGTWLAGGALLGPEERALLPPLVEGGAWRVRERPHVAIDRVRSASALYHSGEAWFAPGCGLHLLVQWRQPGSQEGFERLLSLLADKGLGGERSRGLGTFRWERWKEISWLEPKGLGMLLSRYHPQPLELAEGALAGDGVSYLLEPVGGWARPLPGPAQRRRRVVLLQEGSIVRAVREPMGGLVEVTPRYAVEGAGPAHPIYRYGYALLLGLGGN